MFSKILQGFKERYARFKGRHFYHRVNKVYTRSKEITQERINQQNGGRL
tara:strand:- start:213 stop:359 length:147 start_codon:yes stop_codon:yes gene_type:complete